VVLMLALARARARGGDKEMAPARERDLAAGTMSNRFRGYYTPNDTQCPARGGH